MQLTYESQKPILKTENEGVKIVISFSENPRSSNLKESIVELLTAAYENRVTA
ncbi:MAG: hypothetical protein HFE30_01130 [Clostridiales bacterium]|nr:hypothetical protein [Clostridiales bacterium]